MPCQNCKHWNNERCEGETLYSLRTAADFSCAEFEEPKYDVDIWVMPFFGVINHERNKELMKEIENVLSKYSVAIMRAHSTQNLRDLADRIDKKAKKGELL